MLVLDQGAHAHGALAPGKPTREPAQPLVTAPVIGRHNSQKVDQGQHGRQPQKKTEPAVCSLRENFLSGRLGWPLRRGLSPISTKGAFLEGRVNVTVTARANPFEHGGYLPPKYCEWVAEGRRRVGQAFLTSTAERQGHVPVRRRRHRQLAQLGRWGRTNG